MAQITKHSDLVITDLEDCLEKEYITELCSLEEEKDFTELSISEEIVEQMGLSTSSSSSQHKINKGRHYVNIHITII